MLKDEMKSLQQINKWINGSTGQRINGSKSLIKIANKQNENVKKGSCLEDALKCPAEYEYCCSIVN